MIEGKLTWKLTEQDKLAVAAAFLRGETLKEIGRKFGLSIGYIQVICRKRITKKKRLARRTDKYRPKLAGREKEIVKLYQSGRSTCEIAQSVGADASGVCHVLKRAGVERRALPEAHRIFSFDESAFDTISEESAYWAGFLMADGCVHKPRYSSPSVNLALAERDAEHVAKFRGFLKSGHTIRFQKIKESRQAWSAGSVTASLHVPSVRLCKSLATFGVVPRKSMTAEVKRLQNNPDFWRGMIDGDGWIGFQKTGYPYLGLTGGLAIMNQFVDFVEKKTGKRPKIGRNHSIWNAHVNGRMAVTIVRLLWRDGLPGVSLDRKLPLAQRVLAWEPKGRSWKSVASDDLTKAFEQLGTWAAVAASLGMSHNQLLGLRRRRHMDRMKRNWRPRGLPMKVSLPA